MWTLRVQIKGSLAEKIKDERKSGLIVELSNDESFNSTIFKIAFKFFGEMTPLYLYDADGMQLTGVHDLRADMAVFAAAQEDQFEEVVQINVGGVQFKTLRETLRNSPNSLLATIANKTFLDRPSNLFQIILDFLRTKQLKIPDHISTVMLKQEAEMFEMAELVREIQRQEEEVVYREDRLSELMLKQEGQMLEMGRQVEKLQKMMAKMVVEERKNAKDQETSVQA